jgi:hypothetical protein
MMAVSLFNFWADKSLLVTVALRAGPPAQGSKHIAQRPFSPKPLPCPQTAWTNKIQLADRTEQGSTQTLIWSCAESEKHHPRGSATAAAWPRGLRCQFSSAGSFTTGALGPNIRKKMSPVPRRVAAQPHNGTSGAFAGTHAIPPCPSGRPESPQNSSVRIGLRVDFTGLCPHHERGLLRGLARTFVGGVKIS